MINFIVIMAITNALGGRWEDVYGLKDNSGPGRLIFRCVLPGILAGVVAWEGTGSWINAGWVWFAVTAGSALWFPFGWSFDEINGQYDPNKYPRWVRSIALNIVPISVSASHNRLRGIIMKGIRGGFDILTFVLLTAVNPYALLWSPGTLLQGVAYWTCGRIVKRPAILLAEAVWGGCRGYLIYQAMGL
ncbi:MAG: hypothetical protein SFX19_10200 [Alphaproteobacteria bacterium]|nr:hypothetical protein [Alphaproteobacteria bacterium]